MDSLHVQTQNKAELKWIGKPIKGKSELSIINMNFALKIETGMQTKLFLNSFIFCFEASF